MPDDTFMNLAIEEALQARRDGELPIGAVIVAGGRVVSRDRCRETAQQTVLAHAEMHAVNDACKALGRNILQDCVIYCTNEPCLMCSAAIFQARIARVVIGASRSDFPTVFRPRKLRVEDLAADSGYAPVIIRDVMRDRIIALFADV